jgi:hypothetical protein
MKNKIIFIVVIILCIGCFILGITAERCSSVPIEKIKIRIVEKEKPIYKYIKIPTSCDGYKDCYKKPIEINGKIIDSFWFLVTANDTCKKTERKFKIYNPVKKFSNIVNVQYVHAFSFRDNFMMDIGGNISYYRILFDYRNFKFGIGGGITITNNSTGINLGTLFQF